MKKLFTLVIALFALTFCANAQVSFLNESFDATTLPSGWTVIDADGDGNNWLPSLSYSTGFYAHSGDGCITSASYINYVGALTPDNWLITPQLAVSAGDSIIFWVRGQDANYPSEVYGVYVSTTTPTTAAFTSIYQSVADSQYVRVALSLNAYAGQNIYVAFRHYNVTDMYWLNIDDVQFGSLPSTPTINDLSDINFGQVAVNSSSVTTTPVTAFSLTNDITVTTAAPFSVSADGTTFGTTATLTATTGVGNTTNATLYVKYAPIAVGANNGTITLASTGANSVTANLIGSAISCTVSTFPYNFSFDNDGLAECWDILDVNNDGKTFTISTSASTGYAYYTYSGTNDADDWLISPEFTLTGNEMASFDYWVGLTSFPERFVVYALGADTVLLADTVVANNSSSNPITQYLSLNSLNGNYRIGIHCVSEADQYRLYIDDFSVVNTSTASITLNPTSINFGTVPASSTSNSTFVATILNASNDITVTTAAPFSVSLDNSTYAASVTIPTPSSSVLNQTIYVAYNPTMGGTDSGMVVVSTTGTADTVALLGTSIECNAITSFPFTETFDTASTTRDCWQIVDLNNDGRTFIYGTVSGEWVAAYAYSPSNAANDYLISPEITLTSNLYGHLEYASYGFTEKFSIYVIPANGTLANAVNIVPTVTVDNTNFEVQNFDLSAYANQTVRIAIKAESDADQYYLFIDNFTIEEMPSASITVDPTSMSFSAIAGGTSSAHVANVTAYSLTSDITVNTAAPFEVSADGATFGTTATIPAASIVNDVVYVRYAPTAAGTQSGTVTLTSGSVSATINVTGNALDCSGVQTLPFTEDFEGDLAACWQNIDNDGDGYAWELSSNPVSYYPAGVDISGAGHNETDGFILSGSYTNVSSIALHPDNWLITPAIAIPENGATLKWWVAAQDASYPADHYEVMISTTGTSISNFTSVFNETLSTNVWNERTVNLNNYAGQNIYVAFVHNNCTDEFLMKLDDISVTEPTGINDFDNNVNVYPNPANNVINVNANSNINTVEVFNMMGQQVAAFDANDTNVQINTTALSNGMYMMKITTENGVINQKFTVAR